MSFHPRGGISEMIATPSSDDVRSGDRRIDRRSAAVSGFTLEIMIVPSQSSKRPDNRRTIRKVPLPAPVRGKSHALHQDDASRIGRSA